MIPAPVPNMTPVAWRKRGPTSVCTMTHQEEEHEDGEVQPGVEDTDDGREDGGEEQETDGVLVLARGPVPLLVSMGVDLLRHKTEERNVDGKPEDEEAKVELLSARREDVLPRGVLLLGGLVASG